MSTNDVEERRREDALRAKRRLFEPRGDEGREGVAGAETAPVLGQAGPGSLEAWERLVETWWRRDRDARIRAGACQVCGERGCTRRGGKEMGRGT